MKFRYFYEESKKDLDAMGDVFSIALASLVINGDCDFKSVSDVAKELGNSTKCVLNGDRKVILSISDSVKGLINRKKSFQHIEDKAKNKVKKFLQALESHPEAIIYITSDGDNSSSVKIEAKSNSADPENIRAPLLMTVNESEEDSVTLNLPEAIFEISKILNLPFVEGLGHVEKLNLGKGFIEELGIDQKTLERMMGNANGLDKGAKRRAHFLRFAKQLSDNQGEKTSTRRMMEVGTCKNLYQRFMDDVNRLDSGVISDKVFDYLESCIFGDQITERFTVFPDAIREVSHAELTKRRMSIKPTIKVENNILNIVDSVSGRSLMSFVPEETKMIVKFGDSIYS